MLFVCAVAHGEDCTGSDGVMKHLYHETGENVLLLHET